MNGNDLRKNFERKYRKYFREALKVKVHFRNKDVHEMRVTLKKLSSIIEFINSITKGESEPFLPITGIQFVFHHAGTLRNEQVNLQLLDDRKVSKATLKIYEKAVSGTIKKAKNFLKKELKPVKIHLQKSNQRTLKKIVSQFSDQQVEQHMLVFLRKKWRETDRFIGSKDSMRAMHQVRIRLKHIEALNRLMKENKKFAQPDRLAGIMQEIGEWHDVAVFSDSIKKICVQQKVSKTKEGKELLKLHEELNKKNKSYARDILFTVREFRKKMKK